MMFNKTHICADCGSTIRPVKIWKGSFLLEVILFLCFIIPGLIYSAWRLSATKMGCPLCKSVSVFPLSGPKGKQLAEQFK